MSKNDKYSKAVKACILHDIHTAECCLWDLLHKWHIEYIDEHLVRLILKNLTVLEDDFVGNYMRNFDD